MYSVESPLIVSERTCCVCSQKVLKTFSEPFTAKVGQRIFESMTYCEGSYPLTGVEAIANAMPGWTTGLTPEQSAHTFRFILLISDGISSQRRYHGCCYLVAY
jgi:hypothetical protein